MTAKPAFIKDPNPKPKEARKRLQVEAGGFSPRNKTVAEGDHLTAVGRSAGKVEATSKPCQAPPTQEIF